VLPVGFTGSSYEHVSHHHIIFSLTLILLILTHSQMDCKWR